MSAHEGECSFLVQPFGDDGSPNDRDHCRFPGCGKARSRTVPVDEGLLRSALRDALAFAQLHDFSGDPESKRFIAEYETALLQLAGRECGYEAASAPEGSSGVTAWTVTRLSLTDALRAVLPFYVDPELTDKILAALPEEMTHA